jgi:NADH-quinone oxidoreductase subunit A
MCRDLGSFEVIHFWLLVIVLVVIIIIILSIFSYKNILNRFGLRNFLRKDFYECGLKPLKQKPIQLSIQFFILCIFFILYDIELIFSFPLVSVIINQSFLEVIIFLFIYGSFIMSLIFDIDRYLLLWYI